MCTWECVFCAYTPRDLYESSAGSAPPVTGRWVCHQGKWSIAIKTHQGLSPDGALFCVCVCAIVCVQPWSSAVFVQVGRYKAAVLTCSTPFTSPGRGEPYQPHKVCVFVSARLRLRLCVYVIYVCECDWEVVSVCLDLLVIQAWLFRGNKKGRRVRRVEEGEWQDRAIVLSLNVREAHGRKNGCLFFGVHWGGQQKHRLVRLR